MNSYSHKNSLLVALIVCLFVLFACITINVHAKETNTPDQSTISKNTTQDKTETTSQEISKNTTQDKTEATSKEISKDTTQDKKTETTSQEISKNTSQDKKTETTPQEISKDTSQDKTETTSQEISKNTSQEKAETTSQEISKNTTQDKTETTSQEISKEQPLTTSKVVSPKPVIKKGYDDLYAKKELYKPLSSYDEKLYRQIYICQNNSQWKDADKLMAKLHNKILVGYVLANRYLHWDYTTTFGQNQRWLEKYSNMAIALDIYKLAKRKRPNRYRHLSNWQLVLPSLTVRGINHFTLSLNKPAPYLRTLRTRKAIRYRKQLKSYLYKGLTLTAKRMLQNKDVKKNILPVQYDKYATELAMDYFIDNHIKFAKEWAIPASDRSGEYIPKASYLAGMIYWLESDWKNAKKYFTRSYNAKYATVNQKSKSAFWAGRADLNLRDSQGAWSWFVKSTKYPLTFYSLLAYDMLGKKFPFKWKIKKTERLTTKEQAGVHTSLALALIQIGKEQLAGNELLSVWNGLSEELQSKMTYIIAQNDMASASYRLGNYIGRRYNNINTGLLYPTPKSWKPLEKYTVDPAMMFALMRQESQFNIYAKSYVDARGLLQLMPQTASFIGRDRRWGHHWKYKLFTPSENIKLGEKYVTSLEKQHYITDIIGLLMSWNAGPGNYLKWRKRIKYRTNPLMFIEGIPSEQTRTFVKLVLTNFWVYRSRLGESLLSLHEIAQGKWPTLESNNIIVNARK